jgi:hypothetical protein
MVSCVMSQALDAEWKGRLEVFQLLEVRAQEVELYMYIRDADQRLLSHVLTHRISDYRNTDALSAKISPASPASELDAWARNDRQGQR